MEDKFGLKFSMFGDEEDWGGVEVRKARIYVCAAPPDAKCSCMIVALSRKKMQNKRRPMFS